MGTAEEKRKRFELLMKQGEVPASLVDPYFLDGWIEQVEIRRDSKEWLITLIKETLVPSEVYRTFCLRIQEKMNHIAKIKFLFRYRDSVRMPTSYRNTGACFWNGSTGKSRPSTAGWHGPSMKWKKVSCC